MFKHPYEVYEVHFFPVDPSTVAVTRSYITSKWTKLIFNRCFSFFLRGATYSDDKVPLGHRTEGLRVDFFVPWARKAAFQLKGGSQIRRGQTNTHETKHSSTQSWVTIIFLSVQRDTLSSFQSEVLEDGPQHASSAAKRFPLFLFHRGRRRGGGFPCRWIVSALQQLYAKHTHHGSPELGYVPWRRPRDREGRRDAHVEGMGRGCRIDVPVRREGVNRWILTTHPQSLT